MEPVQQVPVQHARIRGVGKGLRDHHLLTAFGVVARPPEEIVEVGRTHLDIRED